MLLNKHKYFSLNFKSFIKLAQILFIQVIMTYQYTMWHKTKGFQKLLYLNKFVTQVTAFYNKQFFFKLLR